MMALTLLNLFLLFLFSKTRKKIKKSPKKISPNSPQPHMVVSKNYLCTLLGPSWESKPGSGQVRFTFTGQGGWEVGITQLGHRAFPSQTS